MNKNTNIVTITLNPAIDETVFIDHFEVGAVNRANQIHTLAGGKGVNVSRMLSLYGIDSTSTGFLGEDNDGIFRSLFKKRSIEDACVRIPGATRKGIKIVNKSTRETTDINFPGQAPSLKALKEFEKRLRSMIQPGRWFVVCGSLPRGISIDYFEELLAMLKQGGARVAVDTSGAALRAAIEQCVDLIKPNEHELAEVLGRPLTDYDEIVDAAQELQATKVSHVICSLGSEGALFFTKDSSLLASAPRVKVVSTVGAGDALLSGYLAGIHTGFPPAECARLATVFAWSNLENVERRLPAPEVIEERCSQITVQPLETIIA